MILRQTIMFIPQGETEVVKIEIFTHENPAFSNGYWSIDENKVLLTPSLYSHFKSLKTQALQRKFFDQLRKVSTKHLN